MGVVEEVHVGRQDRTAAGHGHLEGYGPHGSAMGEKSWLWLGKGVRDTLVCVYPHNLTRVIDPGSMHGSTLVLVPQPYGAGVQIECMVELWLAF